MMKMAKRKTTATDKTTTKKGKSVNAKVDPEQVFSDDDVIDAGEDGFDEISTSTIMKFNAKGQQIRGVYVGREKTEKANQSDILSFKGEDGKVLRCWSSYQIDRDLDAAGIKPEGTHEVIITFLGFVQLSGRRSVKKYSIQVREV